MEKRKADQSDDGEKALRLSPRNPVMSEIMRRAVPLVNRFSREGDSFLRASEKYREVGNAAVQRLLVMRLGTEQPVVLLPHHRVALARGALQALRVGDPDPPPRVLNQPSRRQRAARLGDARAPHPQHDA